MEFESEEFENVELRKEERGNREFSPPLPSLPNVWEFLAQIAVKSSLMA